MKNIQIGCKAIHKFAKIIKFFSKYSNELFFNAKPVGLEVKVTNQSETTLLTAFFDQLFFVRYEVYKEFDENICKVPCRILNQVLKNHAKAVGVKIWIDLEEERFIVEVRKENNSLVTNRIILLEYEELSTFVSPHEYSELVCDPMIFFKVLQGTMKHVKELEMKFDQDKITIKNYVDQPDEDCEVIRLNYSINSFDLARYVLNEPATLVTSCREFTNMIEMAHSTHSNLKLQFIKSGRPIIASFENEETYTLNFIQTTLPPENLSRRKKKSITYKQIMTEYLETRRDLDEDEEEEDSITDTAVDRAFQPAIASNTENTESDDIQSDDIQTDDFFNLPPMLHSTQKSQARITQRSFAEKRKSIDETNADDTFVDENEVQQKRRRISDNQFDKSKIILSQMEQDEVDSIMQDVFSFCNLGDDDDELLEIHSKSPSIANLGDNDNAVRKSTNTNNDDDTVSTLDETICDPEEDKLRKPKKIKTVSFTNSNDNDTVKKSTNTHNDDDTVSTLDETICDPEEDKLRKTKKNKSVSFANFGDDNDTVKNSSIQSIEMFCSDTPRDMAKYSVESRESIKFLPSDPHSALKDLSNRGTLSRTSMQNSVKDQFKKPFGFMFKRQSIDYGNIVVSGSDESDNEIE